MLEAVGITELHERAYRALLAGPATPVSELASQLGVGSRKAREVLQALREQGLLSQDSRGRYVPVAPDSALEPLIARREAEIEAVRGVAKDLLAEYRSGYRRHQAVHELETVLGREEVIRRIQEETSLAREELLSFDRPPYAVVPSDFDEIAYEQPTLRRGLHIRAIYSPLALELPGRLEHILHLQREGEESRLHPDLPVKLTIFDRSVAFLPLSNHQAEEGVVIIRKSGLLAALIALFEAYWSAARPFGTIDDRSAALDDDDRKLLTMLGAGWTDDAIARQLGVSDRTVRRRMLRILRLHDGATRFEAGAAAARNGWV